VWYIKGEYYYIHSSAESSCTKDEQDTDGKRNEHAQRCRARIGIVGRGSGYNMLPGQSITFMIMYMFQWKIGLRWMKRMKSVSLLVIKMV
jgi:hypothetical protein